MIAAIMAAKAALIELDIEVAPLGVVSGVTDCRGTPVGTVVLVPLTD